jgi:FAD-linked oxidoreductase
MATETWRNWARTQTARPARVEHPRDVEEVSLAVKAAGRDGLTVRPVGSGHSLTGLAATDGVMLDLSALDRVQALDAVTGTVVVEAGIRLRRLWEKLWQVGLEIESLGGLDRQSLGGALATGEHGTGLRFGGIASRVRGLELVLADGSVVTCSERERPDLFQAARVGLGAFGVVTAVQLACVPAGTVVMRHQALELERLLDDADDLLETHDRLEFTWMPDEALLVRTIAERLPAGDPPGSSGPTGPTGRPGRRPRLRSLLGGSAVGRRGGALGRPSGGSFTDRSYRALGLRRGPAAREAEFAVPRACFGAVFEELRARIDQSRPAPAARLRVRFGAAEDAWLAMSQGRETCYIGAHAWRDQPYEPYFAMLETIASRYDGRPHWGRLHSLQANTLRTRYPRFDDARAVRDGVDPERRFANLHLDRVFGD